MGYTIWMKGKPYKSGAFGVEKGEDEAWTAYISRGTKEFYDWMLDLLDEYEIDTLVIEQVPPVSSSAGFNASSQVTLVFMALASVILAAHTVWEISPKIEFMAAQHWRSKLMGKQEKKITKPQIRRKVLEIYPDIINSRKITEIPFDEIDSIAIGWIYINDSTGREG